MLFFLMLGLVMTGGKFMKSLNGKRVCHLPSGFEFKNGVGVK